MYKIIFVRSSSIINPSLLYSQCVCYRRHVRTRNMVFCEVKVLSMFWIGHLGAFCYIHTIWSCLVMMRSYETRPDNKMSMLKHSPIMTSSNGNISPLLAICAGNSPVPGEFPTQRPVTRSFDVFFDLRLNKRLSKQSRGWWLETISRPLWRHRNARLLIHNTHPISHSQGWATCIWSGCCDHFGQMKRVVREQHYIGRIYINIHCCIEGDRHSLC